MASEPRPIEPTEAFALGALHGILREAGMLVNPISGGEEGFDVNDRGFDVYGLVPPRALPVCMRITLEEVQ